MLFMLSFSPAILFSCGKIKLAHFRVLASMPFGWLKRAVMKFIRVHGDFSGQVFVDVASVVDYLFRQGGIGQNDLAELTLAFQNIFQCGLDVLIVIISMVPLIKSEVSEPIDVYHAFNAVLVLFDFFPSLGLKIGHQRKFINKLQQLVGMKVPKFPVIAVVKQSEQGQRFEELLVASHLLFQAGDYLIVGFASLIFLQRINDRRQQAVILRKLEVITILRITGTLLIVRRLRILSINRKGRRNLVELSIGRLKLWLEEVGIIVGYERLAGLYSQNSEVDPDLIVVVGEKSSVLRPISMHSLVAILENIGKVLSGILEDLPSLGIEDLVVRLRKDGLIGLIRYQIGLRQYDWIRSVRLCSFQRSGECDYVFIGRGGP